MAQTQYNPRGAYLYAEALKNQGTNPIVSWFTDSQGGGLNNWIQDQGNQIASRTRNDILRELTDDPMMLERARTAQNEGRDFRKELLGDRYFVNPHDAVLNAGVDNVKTKSENRLRKKFSEALAESLNADKYKADGTTAEALAKSLGYENLSPELLTELKEGEQSALKQRYENQLYRDIAQKRLKNPNATVDDIISNYRDKYGLNLNPDTYLDPENETMKKFMKAGLNQIISDVINSNLSLDEQKEVLEQVFAAHPEYAQQLTEAKSNIKNTKDTLDKEHFRQALQEQFKISREEGEPDEIAIDEAVTWGRGMGIPDSVMADVLKDYQTINGLAINADAIKADLQEAEAYAQDTENKIRGGKLFFTPNTTLTGEYSKLLSEAGLSTIRGNLNKEGITDEKEQNNFLNYVYSEYNPLVTTADNIKVLFNNPKEYRKIVEEYKLNKKVADTAKTELARAKRMSAYMQAKRAKQGIGTEGGYDVK